jgi:hypothetical protein
MIRGFVAGNLMVGFVMAVATTLMLLGIGMIGAIPLGIASGLLNLVPFFESLLHAFGQSLNDRRGDRARDLPLINRFDNYRLSGLSHSDFQHITFLQFLKYGLIRGIKSSELRKRGAIIFGLSVPATTA